MNTSKLFFFFTFLIISEFVYCQDINFLDQTFKQYLLNHIPTIDLDNDGEISVGEAVATKVLNLDVIDPEYDTIISLSGIENFSELESLTIIDHPIDFEDFGIFPKLNSLDVKHNKLISIELSSNINLLDLEILNPLNNINLSQVKALKRMLLGETNLTELEFPENSSLNYLFLTTNDLLPNINFKPLSNLDTVWLYYNPLMDSLDVSQNLNLEYVVLFATYFENLDFSNNNNLKFLDCRFNITEELNLGNAVNLVDLFCAKNPIKSLDLSTNINLEQLVSFDCQLEELDLCNNVNLIDVRVEGNLLKTLDVSTCPNLEILIAGDNLLESVNIMNTEFEYTAGSGFDRLNLFQNHFTLHEICVEPEDTIKLGYLCNYYEHLNVSYSSDCISDCVQEPEEFLSEHINIYPIPANDQIFITSQKKISVVEILTIGGRTVFKDESLSTSFYTYDIGEMEDGFYVMRLIDAEGTSLGKIFTIAR